MTAARAFAAVTACTDPYHNLALEQALLARVPDDGCVLYLWRNADTVVIGKNQCADLECDLDAMEREGVRLARRLSGGGAVFHDLGNLNFSFLAGSGCYDVSRQLKVVVDAVRSFGLPAEITGRNDLTVDDRKFSGNAFFEQGGHRCHHGTLLLQASGERMSRCLRVSPGKLRAKGVSSVRARVVNLGDLCPRIDVCTMREALLEAFAAAYGRYEMLPEPAQRELAAAVARFSSPQWLHSRRIQAAWEGARRFAWGELRLRLAVSDRVVTQCQAYSDALDEELCGRVSAALQGQPFVPEKLAAALRLPDPSMENDVRALLLEAREEAGETDGL
ncbi:MAG: lipoate--protein ligase [Eubacteriales bacterium]|nr:lipoate--protein ligase [Eubacteriales bacterium]